VAKAFFESCSHFTISLPIAQGRRSPCETAGVSVNFTVFISLPVLNSTPMACKGASLPLRLMLRTAEPQVVSSPRAKACGAKTRSTPSYGGTKVAFELARSARSPVSTNHGFPIPILRSVGKAAKPPIKTNRIYGLRFRRAELGGMVMEPLCKASEFDDSAVTKRWGE